MGPSLRGGSRLCVLHEYSPPKGILLHLVSRRSAVRHVAHNCSFVGFGKPRRLLSHSGLPRCQSTGTPAQPARACSRPLLPPLHPHALCPAPSFVASSPPPLYPCSRRLKYTSGSRHPLWSGLWSIPTRLGLVAQGHDLRMKGQPDRVKELKVFARQFLTPRVKCFRLESARCNRDEAVGRRIRRPFSELAPAAA